MTVDEYREAREEYHGFCTECEAVTLECGVEPDARDYKCPECGLFTVIGIEEALIDGRIEITED